MLRFAVGFAVLMGIFYSIWFSDFFIENMLNPVMKVNAWMAAQALKLAGYKVTINDLNLASPSFTLSVGRGCDAIEPMAIFLFAVLLFPATIKSKLRGIAIGIPILFLINQFRIITLYLLGYYSEPLFGKKREFYFDLVHIQVWPVFFILITLALLAWWIISSMKREQIAVQSTT